VDDWSDNLRELADRVDYEASISARPGQLDRLEKIAGELRLIARMSQAETPHVDLPF